MISVKETTKNAEYPNHIYILSDDKTKLYACLPLGKKDWFKYNPPLRFDPRGRTFKSVGQLLLTLAKDWPNMANMATWPYFHSNWSLR